VVPLGGHHGCGSSAPVATEGLSGENKADTLGLKRGHIFACENTDAMLLQKSINDELIEP
jgi:hypothetical protein